MAPPWLKPPKIIRVEGMPAAISVEIREWK
jgi:hypothetical protein